MFHINSKETSFNKSIEGFISIACGLIEILTLGFVSPSWDCDWSAHCLIKGLRKYKQRKNRH